MTWNNIGYWPACGVVLAIGIAFLTACAKDEKPEPRVIVQRVDVPVPVPCNVTVPAQPSYPDDNAALRHASPDIDKQVQFLLAARELRGPYERGLVAALIACGAKVDTPGID